MSSASIYQSRSFSGPAAVSFPDPYQDMASQAMPETMQYALRWTEFILMRQGTYRQAIDRVLSYFITDIEISDASDEEKEKYEKFLRETLGIYKHLHTIGFDFLCYGNAFFSVMLPFRRYLYCPHCFFEAPLKYIYENPQFKFQWEAFEFHAHCPNCNKSGKWGRQDRRETDENEVIVKRWNPHEMEILWDPLTDKTKYIWKIPEDYRKAVREGKLHHLENVPWHLVETIRDGGNMLFDKNAIFHVKEDSLAGIRSKGWGISRVLVNFGQAWYVQVLRRYNEAIALDYVIPFRVISPPSGQGAGGDASIKDPLLNMNLGGFVAKMHQMIREHRRDPARWHISPHPIQYQTLGGDATKLAPRELLDQGLEILLNDIGVPAELYKGSLQVQTAPAALRLFEASWTPLIFNLNAILRYIVNRLSYLLGWKPAKARLMRVTHADDLNRQMAKLQLMMGKQVSPSTGLKSIGIDYKEEIMKIMEDQKAEAKAQAEMQEDMDQIGMMQQMQQGAGGPGGAPGGAPPGGAPGGDPSQGGAAPPGGQPGAAPGASIASNLPTGPNVKITPQELLGRAQTIAQQIMGLPETQKDSELINLKKTDPVLHDLVRSQMDELRSQAKNVGGAQVLAQQFGKSGAMIKWSRMQLREYIGETSRLLQELFR